MQRLAVDWMSEVYKVKTVGIAGFEKVQVLKRIRPPLSQDPRFVQSFVEQAKVAFSLNHRNIVQVFEFGKTGEDLFLAMEHIPGLNLMEVLKTSRSRRQPFSVGLACYLMGEVASGLEYAHRKTDHYDQSLDIVHCDLNPRNLACSFEGSVKILGFGISRTAWQMDPLGERYQGNPRHLSPEQVRGQPLDTRSDIFSFGVVLWEMLTGIPLFEGTDRETIFHKILEDPVPSPRSLNPEVPARLDELAMHCLVRDLEQRFDTVSDLQLELHRVQRQLGAVIGSRALSTFISELFPGHDDTLDVRAQSQVMAGAWSEALRPRDSVLNRGQILFEESDSDLEIPVSREVYTADLRVKPTRPMTPVGRSPGSDPTSAPVAQGQFVESENAGMLRAGRHPDEDVSAVHIAHAGATGLGLPLADPDSEELLTRPPSPATEEEPAAEELSVDDLMEVDLEPEPDRQPAVGRRAVVDPLARTALETDQQGRPLGDIDMQAATSPDSGELVLPPTGEQGGAWDEWGEEVDEPLPAGGPMAAVETAGLRPRRAESVSDSQEALPFESPGLEPAPDQPTAVESLEDLPPRDADEQTLSVTDGTPLPEPHSEFDAWDEQTLDIPEGMLQEVRSDELEALEAREAPAPKAAPEAPAAGLGEKKRFIAVTVLLDGPAEALQEAGGLVADIAYKLHGTLHQREDGRLMVLFGLPTADEHDIVSAVRFAVDSREAVHGIEPSRDHTGAGANMRVGIRAGTARVGQDPLRQGYQLLGKVLAETEAIARHAGPGQVMIAGIASRLARAHYSLREDTTVSAKRRSVRTYRVLGPLSRTRKRARLVKVPPVGREVEVRAIKAAWGEAVLERKQRTSLLVGEAGIGKTRVLDHFLDTVASDARLLAASATPHRRGVPNSVLVDLLRNVTGIWGSRGPALVERMQESLAGYLGPGSEDDVEALVSVVVPHEGPGPAAGGALNPVRLYRALRALFNRLILDRPLVVALGDLHWADRASVECITALVESPEESGGALLFVITARLGEGLDPQDLFHTDSASLVLLNELDQEARRHLIAAELGDGAAAGLVDEVERRTGGNPFYILELSRALRELKAPSPSSVPPTVQRVIAGRVDQFPQEVKAVLQHAAVIGPSFREGILARLLQRNPAHSLATLRNSGIIVPGLRMVAALKVEDGESEQFEREWAFRNVLLQEVVYEAISATGRRDLHSRVGQIMARRTTSGSTDAAAEVARHLDLGGRSRQAGEFYLKAANEAAASFASVEALRLYGKALELSGDDPEPRYAIHAGRERVYAQLGKHEDQARELEQLRRLCGDDARRVADLRNREALHLMRLGEFNSALLAANQAEEAAIQAGDALAHGEALRQQGEAYDRLNDRPRALESVSNALRIFSDQGARPNQIRARISLGRINLVRARYDDALGHFEPALALIKQIGDRWQERILRSYLGVVHYCMGNFAQSLGEALYSLKLCEQFGDIAREGDNAAVAGVAYMELGQLTAARKHLEAALQVHRRTGSQWSEADVLIFLGLVECGGRHFNAGLRLLDQAQRIARRIGAKSISMNARNAMSWILCERGAAGDHARALEEATRAVEIARRADLVVGEIPGLCRSGRAQAALGDLQAARELSGRAVELLQRQRYIEGAEEEIYYTHFRILDALGAPGAQGNLQLAYEGLYSKMKRLDSAEWQDTFVSGIRLNAAIVRDYRRQSRRDERGG